MRLVLVVDGEGRRAFRLPGGQVVQMLAGGESFGPGFVSLYDDIIPGFNIPGMSGPAHDLPFDSPLDIFGVNDPGGLTEFGVGGSFPQSDMFAVNPSSGGDFEGSDIGAIQQRIRDDMDLNEVLVGPDGTLVDSSGRPVPPGSSTWQKVKDVLSGTSAAINSPLGRLLTTLGLGFAGQGLGQLVANKPGRLTLPAPTAGQNPVLLEGGRLMEAALKDPQAASAFQEAVKRSLVGQSTAAGFLNEAIAREASFANKTAGATEALRTFGLSEIPKFLANEQDIAEFKAGASAVSPEINEWLATRTGYPQQEFLTPEQEAQMGAPRASRPAVGTAETAAKAAALPNPGPPGSPYGTLGPADYPFAQAVYERVQRGELTTPEQVKAALANHGGGTLDEAQALIQFMVGSTPGGGGPAVTRTTSDFDRTPAIRKAADWIKSVAADGTTLSLDRMQQAFIDAGLGGGDAGEAMQAAQAMMATVTTGAPEPGQSTTTTGGGGGGSRTLVAPNPLHPYLQSKARSLIMGSPADFALAPDPIQGAMRDRVLRAIQGGEVDPALERQIAEDLEVLRNKLKLAYGTTGTEWDSTLGQNLYLKALESANALRYGVNREVINSMGPQEAARRTFQITNPQQMYLSESGIFVPAAERSTEFNQQARAQNEQLRQSALNMLMTQRNTALRNAAEVKAAAEAQRRTLATFNPVNLSVLNPAASTFSSIASIPSLSNVNDSASRLAIDAARNQAVRDAFEAEQRAEAARVKSFTDIFAASAANASRPDIIYRGEDPGAF